MSRTDDVMRSMRRPDPKDAAMRAARNTAAARTFLAAARLRSLPGRPVFPESAIAGYSAADGAWASYCATSARCMSS